MRCGSRMSTDLTRSCSSLAEAPRYRRKLNFTSSAVKGSPLWNFRPSRSLNSYTRPSGLSFQDSARHGAMSLPGSGLMSASCMAYRNTNGVPMPGVSAGSRKVGAIEASKAMVNCPSGWACAATSPVDVPSASRNRSAIDAVSLLMPSLHGVLEPFDRAPCVVREREDLVELDLRPHAVALDDAVEPCPAVEALGILARLPLIDASRPAALAPDEVLADQALHLLEVRRDLVEVLPAGGVVDVGRQLVSDGGRDHPQLLAPVRRASSPRPP